MMSVTDKVPGFQILKSSATSYNQSAILKIVVLFCRIPKLRCHGGQMVNMTTRRPTSSPLTVFPWICLLYGHWTFNMSISWMPSQEDYSLSQNFVFLCSEAGPHQQGMM